MAIAVTHFSDPVCPWAYSESPALAVLRWRYGAELSWRHVMIGLRESADALLERGFTPERQAKSFRSFRDRYGMPFEIAPKSRLVASSRACRAVVATRLVAPEHEPHAFRALQLTHFNGEALIDEDMGIAAALRGVPGLDVPAIVAQLDDAETWRAYEADRELARSAAGSPTEYQGKAAVSDEGRVRYTAPSLIFEAGGRRLEAGGFQPVEAYDALIANLDPKPVRRPAATDPVAALQAVGYPLTTQELAAVMAGHNEPPDRAATEEALIGLAAKGRLRRVALGDDALWDRSDAALSAAA